MGSSSSNCDCYLLEDSEALYDSEIYQNFNKDAEVSVRGIRFGVGLVHHGIIVNIKEKSHYWALDWCMDDVCRKIKGTSLKGSHRRTLGTYKVKEIYEAVKFASDGRVYKWSDYNCNHWTNKFGSYLNWNLDCGGLMV